MVKAENKAWIEKILKKFEFIQWDRFILHKGDDSKFLDVFGWIDREKDSYKDFILIEFDVKAKQCYLLATSSDKYSERICQMFNTEHNKCRRVEDNFHIENSIKLNKKEISPTDSAKS